MNKMLRNCFLVAIFLVQALHLNAQVVFSETFTAPIAGFPPPGLTVASSNTDFTPGSASGMQIGGSAGSIVFTPDQLAAWVTVATMPLGLTNNGYTQGTGLLSSYLTPFNTTLSLNTYILSWAFNMQTGILATGFSDGRDDAAVILACDNADVRNAGNGYAVTYQPFVPGGLQLVRYSGGLLGTVTPIISSGAFLGSATNYASIRVTYDPTTDDWGMELRDDGPIAFDDPTVGTPPFTVFTAVTDATYTATPMTHFGFYANYSVKHLGPADPDVINAYFDNYSLTMVCAPIAGTATTCVGGLTTLTHIMPGGIWSSSDPGIATVVNPAIGDVTGTSPGTAIIWYTTTSCIVGITVTVDPTVISPITGDTMICRTETTALSSAPFGGAWSNLHTTLGGIDAFSGVYTPLLAGNDTVFYELYPGCTARRTVHIDSSELITGVTGICVGSNSTLANAISGGTWSSSATSVFTVTSGGVISGVSPATTATVSYLNPHGCTVSRSVTVYALPAVITGDMRICVGTTSTLNSSPAGGTWSHSASGAGTVDPSTGVVTGAATGTSIITYTEGTSSAGCIRTAIVTVDPAPAALTGTASMCANSSSLLSHTVGGGTWATSNATNATVNALGNVTGVIVTGGTATITYTLPTSGCITTREVTVLALPNAITGTQSVCVGGTTTLNTTTPSATWSSGNGAIATIDALGVVSGNTAGTVNITTTSPNGCFRFVNVTVNPIPAAITGTPTVCIGATTLLSTTSTGGTWGSSNIIVATVSGGTVTGITGGTATITYNRLGCITTRMVTVYALPSAFTGPSTVCINSTVTLTSAPAGTWSSSNTPVGTVGAGTGVVGGVSAGTTNITYVIPSGCQRVRTMTVNSLPAAIGGPVSLCPGSSATLTNTATGTWASGNTAVATIVTGTGVYTGVTAGTSNITFVQTSSGCAANITVTIAPAPPAVITPIGDTIMCPGDFVTLSVSTSPGVTYEWYNGASLILGAGSPTYIATTAGTYRAEVHVAAGCSSASAPISVTITPATATVTVGGAGGTSTCAGTPVVLNANAGPGLTYQWQLAGSPISGATNVTFNANASGNYSVRVTNPAGCWAVSAAVSVTVFTSPSNVVTASGSLNICNGSSVTLTAASGAGYTYQWYNASGPIVGATSMSYSASTAESYYVTVTNAAGCTATSTPSLVVVNPLPDVTITPNNPLVFCAGGNVLLQAAPGFTYQWYSGGTAIPGAVSPTYAATTSGNYRVRVTNGATGCSDMTHADTVVTVIGTVTAMPLTPAKFCWGGSSLLSTTASTLGSYLSYQWFFNGVPIPGAIGSTYLANAAGNYHCVVGVPSSCTRTTNTVSVSQVPLPDPSVAFNGTSIYTGNYYISYQWYKNLVPVAGATSWSTPATGNGDYKVAVTDTNGCQSVSARYVLTGWTAVIDINNPEIRIFPSPAKETVNIESSVNVRAIISSIDGKMLINQPNARVVNLRGIADGIYIITLYNDNGQLIKTEKLVKHQ